MKPFKPHVKSRSKKHCPLGGDKKNWVGYCKLHHRGVTVKQMKNRECIAKECWHFRKQDHPYWNDRKKGEEPNEPKSD